MEELLLKDLCARLPYGVICQVETQESGYRNIQLMPDNMTYLFKVGTGVWKNCKPYLRPISSMTEEEKKELSVRYVYRITYDKIQIRYHSDGYWDNDTECPTEEYLKLFDWLNAHHFDYRGLIEKGLALEAPEDMYK